MTSISNYKKLNLELIQRNKELMEQIAALKAKNIRLKKVCQEEREHAVRQVVKCGEALTGSSNNSLLKVLQDFQNYLAEFVNSPRFSALDQTEETITFLCESNLDNIKQAPASTSLNKKRKSEPIILVERLSQDFFTKNKRKKRSLSPDF